jgi:hypothetical protein
MNDSRKILSELKEELSSERSRWEEIQVEWAPSYSRRKESKSPILDRSTYLSHVMANDITSTSSQSKCMFHAALKQMTPSDARKRFIAEEVSSQCSFGCVLSINGEKFSTELAGLDPTDTRSTSMTDFSRFLFYLAGETDLANAPDTARLTEQHVGPGESPVTRKDRLIR